MLREIRLTKQHSILEVAHYCHTTQKVVQDVESGKVPYVEFLTWVCLTSYYGKAMLVIPFIIHRLEWPVAEEYFMYLRNGEPVQYSAKEARKLIVKD
jgi:hypothetical protein